MTLLEPTNSTERLIAIVYWHHDAIAYHANIADYEGEGPRGEGKTKLAALHDLFDQCEDPRDRVAVVRAALSIDPVAGEEAVGAA